MGHSTLVWLEHNPHSRLYSWDLCQNACSQQVIEFMRFRYGDRFHLTCGDSRVTVPAFAQVRTGLCV